jgi:hypothetical protein
MHDISQDEREVEAIIGAVRDVRDYEKDRRHEDEWLQPHLRIEPADVAFLSPELICHWSSVIK